MENTETNPWKSAKAIYWESGVFLTNDARTTGYPYTQKRLIWTHTAYDTQKLTETEHKPKALLKKKKQ